MKAIYAAPQASGANPVGVGAASSNVARGGQQVPAANGVEQQMVSSGAAVLQGPPNESM